MDTPNPQPQNKKTLYTVLALLALAVVVALTAFALVRMRPSQNSDEVAKLQQKLDAAEDVLNRATAASSTKNGTEDKRILLTTGDLDKYCGLTATMRGACIQNIRTDEPNATDTYRNTEKGLFVQIPYNTAWSNETFRLRPFDEERYQIDANRTEDRLAFGYLSLFEGGGVVRWYGLNFTPVRSAEEAIRALQADAATNGLVGTPEQKSVNGITYLLYNQDGFCGRPSIEVMGRKANYLLAPMCGTPETAFPFLESIVKTIRLID